MSRHEGVSCDACLKANFKGWRYKCLVCYDYDLCASCYDGGATTTRHTTEHPMQCILTRNDFELYYGGEGPTPEHPQSLTCPFCGKLGLTEVTMGDHVRSEHVDANTDVVCPICASVPGGEPNHVTDDFATHISYDHRNSGGGSSSGRAVAMDLDEGGGGSSHAGGRTSGMRRMQYQGRGLGRAVPRRNLTFGSVGTGLFPTSRESMDPIAELLSQLTGVRRPNVSSRQQQPQWQEPRHEVTDSRRSNRRGVVSSGAITSTIANNAAALRAASSPHITASSSANGNPPTVSGLMYGSVLSGSSSTEQPGRILADGSSTGAPSSLSAGVTTTTSSAQPGPTSATVSASPQFLLSRLNDSDSEKETPQESIERSAFVRELLISTLTTQLSSVSLTSPTITSNDVDTTQQANTSNEADSKEALVPALVVCSSDASTQTIPVSIQSFMTTTTTSSPSPPYLAKPMVPTSLKGRKVGVKPPAANQTGAITKSGGGRGVSTGNGGGGRASTVGGGGTGNGGGGGGGVSGGGNGVGGGANNGAATTAVSPPSQTRKKLARGAMESRASEPPPPH